MPPGGADVAGIAGSYPTVPVVTIGSSSSSLHAGLRRSMIPNRMKRHNSDKLVGFIRINVYIQIYDIYIFTIVILYLP